MPSLKSSLFTRLPSNVSNCNNEIDEELSFHIAMSQQEYQAQGYSETAAKELAESRFGNQQKIRNACLKEKLAMPLSIKILTILAFSVALYFFATEIVNVSANAGKKEWKRVSPFEAVQIIGDRVKVNIADSWYELRSINQHSTNEIMTHSKEQYQAKWKKRFIEDIYEVLQGMGNLPSLNVEVELVDVDGVIINRHIAMTKHKRKMSWLYAREQQATTDKERERIKTLRGKLIHETNL